MYGSGCGVMVKKSLSTKTHTCACGVTLDRDHNAALNILKIGLSTVGHIGTNVSRDIDLCAREATQAGKSGRAKRKAKE